MRHYNVSLTEILDAASQVNANAGGGVLYEYGNEYIIRGDVNTSSVNAIGKSVVRSDERGTVLLEDVATVATGNKLPRIGVASERTKPAVLITVTKQPEQAPSPLPNALRTSSPSCVTPLPSDVNVSTDIFKQSDFIDNSISNLQQSLLKAQYSSS